MPRVVIVTLLSDVELRGCNELYFAGTAGSAVIGPAGYPPKLGNADGRNSIVSAWSGAGWDWIHERMLISGGSRRFAPLRERHLRPRRPAAALAGRPKLVPGHSGFDRLKLRKVGRVD